MRNAEHLETQERTNVRGYGLKGGEPRAASRDEGQERTKVRREKKSVRMYESTRGRRDRLNVECGMTVQSREPRADRSK